MIPSNPSPDTGAGTPLPPFELRAAIIDAVRGSDPIAAITAFGAYDDWWDARSRPATDPAVHVHDYGAARIPCSNPECRPATDPAGLDAAVHATGWLCDEEEDDAARRNGSAPRCERFAAALLARLSEGGPSR